MALTEFDPTEARARDGTPRLTIQPNGRLVENADVEYVGEDHEYVPDCPRLRRTHPNAEEGDNGE